MPFEIDECLALLVRSEGSDLHLKVNSPPMGRVDGELRPLDADADSLTQDDAEGALRKLISTDRAREEFAAEGEVDFSYSLKGVSRFRVNAFRQRGSVSIVCRAIPFQVRTIEDLGLPPVIRKLADEQRGIILLTGTTGSGKSTTLAAMIDHINSNYSHHIVTLEDPIEYLHRDKKSIINQREVGSDTKSFGKAMRRILRQDPDVILVGEMRDEETVRTALSAAETGHLVLSTLHTLDATETINRIIDFFPPHLQQQARVMLSATLRGAVSQRLVPTSDGVGRIAASEIMVVTGRIQDLILNPNETGKISQVIAEGEFYGMQTFDQSLLRQVRSGLVDEAVAMGYASSPHDFKLMLASAGKRASDLSQLDDEPGGEKPAPDRPYDDPPEAPEPAAAEPAPEPEPAATAPEPVAPLDRESMAAPAPGGESAQIDYGSADHAYGRSVTPVRPAPEPAETPGVPVEASGAPATGEDEEYGAGEELSPPPDGEHADVAPAAKADGLGGAEFAEIWETPAPAENGTPRAALEQDRLSEFRPRPPE